MSVLYHASPRQGLHVLKPYGVSKRDPDDPPRVYAARKEVVASMFMMRDMNDDWSKKGSWDRGKTWWAIIGDENRFRYIEKEGGSIYSVSEEGFFHDLIGLGRNELYIMSDVQVVKEEQWESALDAMLHYGVNVLFVSKQVFLEIRRPDDQWALIEKAERKADGTFAISAPISC